MSEPTTNEYHFPTSVATEGLDFRAVAMLLEQPVINARFRPIGGKARCFSFVEYTDTILNLYYDLTFRFVEDRLQFFILLKLYLWF